MATDGGGTRPLTQFVAGNGQSAVSYTLPAGLFQYIQSVVATIDTSGAGDVQPLLTVTDDAGIVVADKQQGQSIDAGGSGRATWALRLTDESTNTLGLHWGPNTDATALGLKLTSTSPLGIWYVSEFGQWDANGGGLSFRNDDTGTTGVISRVEILNTGIEISTSDGTTDRNIDVSSGDAQVRLRSSATGAVFVQSNPSGLLSFFAATAVGQQPTPVTLGDVIAVLQTFGLVA